MIVAIRGATTLSQDSLDDAKSVITELWQTLLEKNNLDPSAIISIFFTVTEDIKKVSPPMVTRQVMNWQDIPMMCAVEPDIEGFPERCIRVLIHAKSTLTRSQVSHVYLGGAASLRPDLQ